MRLPKNKRELNQALIQIERKLCATSLRHFIKHSFGEVDPNELKWNWHIDYIAELLEAVAKGQIQRLLINIPPGCMKSLSVSTMYPAWDWIANPGRRFIASTYAQELSNKNAKMHRDLVQGAWYQERWPHVRISVGESRKVRFFANSEGGFRMSTSVTGTVTGFHGDVLIWDDLVNAKDAQGRSAVNQVALKKANEYRFETLVTRRADPSTTAIVGVMQRLHYGDPSQRCIDQGDHVVLTLPMEYDPKRHCAIQIPYTKKVIEDPRKEKGELLWPNRFPQEVVQEMRKDLGSLAAAAQLDQNPAPLEGAIFHTKWFKNRWKEVPAATRQIITVDCTFKDGDSSDYVVMQCWGSKNSTFYLLDQLRGKWNVTKTMEMIGRMREKWPKAIGTYIEDKANGPAIIQMLKGKISGINAWSPGRSSKVERAESIVPVLEAQNVLFPPDDQAPWIGDYITEMTRFPVDVHDDQVDATTMALLILHTHQHTRMKKFLRAMGDR